MQAVFDRDDGARRLPVPHCINCIFERKAWQRHAIGGVAERRQMRIGARRALIGDGARRIGGGLSGQLRDDRARGCGIVFHGC
jgi:hypothetical protein